LVLKLEASTPTPALAIREAGAYGKIFGFNSDAALTCLGVWESQATMEYVPCTGSVPMTLTGGNRRRGVRMSILLDALPSGLVSPPGSSQPCLEVEGGAPVARIAPIVFLSKSRWAA